MTGITGSAKAGVLEDFCDHVRNFANAVCGITENASQVRAEFCYLSICVNLRIRILPDLHNINLFPIFLINNEMPTKAVAVFYY